MSLSNKDEQFQPLAISSLERFDDEVLNKTDKSDPDFDRFKLLFEVAKFKEDGSDDFKAMYDPQEEKEAVVFEPLIETDKETDTASSSAGSSDETPDGSSDGHLEPKVPELTPEEIGFQEGLQKGLDQGTAQGEKKGYEDGFKRGEEDGFIKGEKEGTEKGQAQGFEKGSQEGEQKGEADAKEKAVQLLTALEQTLQTADQTLEMLVDKYEENIIGLIQQIAQKTIMAKIEMDDEIVKPMILDALKTLVQPEEIVLSVSLDDYEYIEMVKDEFFEQIDSLSRVTVKSDASLQKGNFNIETNTGVVSSNVESKLDAIFKAIKKAGEN